MTATQDDTIAELRRANIALQERLDAALSEKATLAAELAARDAALAQRATEYSERIEQQSATVDVLKVMSASPGDPQPVFALIVDRAKKLCDSYGVALYQYDGTLVHLSAFSNYPAPTQDELAYIAMFPMPPTRSSIACRAILDGEIIHIRDMRADSSLSPAVRALDLGSNLAIPLIRDGKVIGTFNLNSKEAGGFSDSQVALLQTFAEQAVIAISSAETYRALQTRTSDLQESLEYQTATSDVLKVISQSTFDLQPVLETVAATAARLCEADQAVILRREGEAWRFAVNFGFPPEYEAYLKAMGSVKLDRDSPAVAHRTATEGRPVHIDDVAAVPGYPEALIRLGKQRTSLGVPLLRDGETIGLIQLSRQRVEPFTDRQIELVSTFADQAVIAIENTRLITEQQEALEQQTATAEILQVINASPGNLAPVFEAMLEKATRLCEAACGVLWTHEGEVFRAAALRGVPPAYSEFVTSQPRGSSPGGVLGRLVRGEPLVHIPDAASPPPQDAIVRTLVELGNIRTLLAVPLRKDDALLGAFTIYREEIRPFSDKQIALLENFAAQAVIAMENARLIDEQREALEQQTATAEVLQVINASPGNLAPVFDTMLDKAMRLCDAAFGELYGFDGEGFPSLALKNVPAAYSASRRAGPVKPIPGSFAARFIAGEYVIHIPDLKDEDAYRSGNAVRRAMVDLGGARTAIAVALHVDDQIRGALIVYRQEVRPVTGKQIAVLENFAVQAVIAMENARLITEQREALEQQTATAEVLQVINGSPGELTPVFEAILEKAHRICGATIGSLILYDGECLRAAATHGFAEEFADLIRQPFRPTGRYQRLIDGERFVQAMPVDAISLRQAEVSGVRSTLAVPLRKDTVFLGAITAHRTDVRPFDEKEIVLLENFASQAAIAMENARLLDEIRQRQAELRTTFDNMGDGVAMFDADLRLAAWNRNFQQIIDLPDALLRERPRYADYMRLLAERGEFGATGIEAELRQRIEDTDKELRLERVRPDGRVIEVRRNAVSGGGFVLIYSDITERKRSEEEIRAARDAAETALRELRTAQANLIQAEKMASLGQLTAGIAHEIKNPLNFVNNFAELSGDLLDELNDAVEGNRKAEIDELRATLQGNLAKITEHGKRADGIVKAMLEHSRGSSGERRMVDLNVLIDEALNLAYHGARAQDQSFNITLVRDFGADMAPIEVNPQDITRVFLNIISNGFYAATRRARDGGDAGFEPTLKVTTHDAGDAVEIRVQDNGTGIPADIRDKLFQPFFTTKPTGEGTGLGLSITYDIVTQQHGGSIAVDSEVGAYSEFTIRLPRNR